MIELVGRNGVYLVGGKTIVENKPGLSREETEAVLGQAKVSLPAGAEIDPAKARENTMAHRILMAHNTSGDPDNLKIRFDAMASHDITYVGIVQTARASGLVEFPAPYALTNCHNSLCAVGGTINEDDHVFGLSAARKYGGIYVPAHQAVIHQYVREMLTGCGKMVLGSDSHTRYGPLGTMGVGEGGPELVKQLLRKTYDIPYPEIIAIYLEGKPRPGVGPQDVALALIKAVFPNGYVKNKVLEFVGPGIGSLSVDFRNGIDVMTTETTCLSSIWPTDGAVEAYYRQHGRPEEFRSMAPGDFCYYDGMVKIDLSRVEPMIALPFHPSNAFTIDDLNAHANEILPEVEAEGQKQLENPKTPFKLLPKLMKGRLQVDQGVVAGCSGGTFENICAMAEILDGRSVGTGEFALSVYPASQPIYLELIKNGAVTKLMTVGATLRSAFCGPCFGAGDVPANQGLSIRHTTRNFPSREGSKPGQNQIASVALMDARSIAATAANGGWLTPATEVPVAGSGEAYPYTFDQKVYENRVYQGYGQPHSELELKFGPNIADWPEMGPLTENLLLKLVSVIRDPVTTTDELIPSGETSSYRSNPMKLAEFTLSRKDPAYVGRAKAVQLLERERTGLTSAGNGSPGAELSMFLGRAGLDAKALGTTGLGSVIFANKPGDGSAREQAASCQKVLGGCANIAVEYATKRYRSNLINWGMLPFIIDPAEASSFEVEDLIYIPGIRDAVRSGKEEVAATVISSGRGKREIRLKLPGLAPEDREIILAGCLINFYAL